MLRARSSFLRNPHRITRIAESRGLSSKPKFVQSIHQRGIIKPSIRVDQRSPRGSNAISGWITVADARRIRIIPVQRPWFLDL